MSGKPYPEASEIEAVKQVVDRGHSVSSVATRLGIPLLPVRLDKEARTNKEKSDGQARDPPAPERAEAGY